MQKRRVIGWMVILLMIVQATMAQQWHTKWHEVTGEATIVLVNNKDIHDDINVSAKKKLVMDATLDALQNAINLRLNPVISTQAYKSTLEKDYLMINDHLIDLLAQQDIVWQRQASPQFIRDEDNPKKWTVRINGLVKKANTETPPVIVQTETPKPKQEPVVIERSVPVEPQPEQVIVKQKKPKKKRDYQRFFLGLNAGANYSMASDLYLDNDEYIDVNEGLGYQAGVRLPIGRNFVIGGDYHYQEMELGSYFDFGGPGNSGMHRWGHGGGYGHGGRGGYDEFNATHEITMTGFGVSIGSYRNWVNPSIGAFYQRGNVFDLNSGTETGEILKRGATFGLDFGRGRVKVGVEATAFWLNADATFDGFGETRQPVELLSDVQWEEVNLRFGVNLKLFL